jgi:transcription elongation factor Elf1
MMTKTPDDRQIYTCPTCQGSRVQQVERAGGTETVDCKQCDGSGQIVGPPT